MRMNSLFDQSLIKGCIIVFIGPPLVGKGVQSKVLAEFLGIPVVSSGDVFREVVASGSELGQRLHTIMSSGGLVPNDLVLEVFLEYLSAPSFAGGFILDGFVREKENLETLRVISEQLALKVLTFIYLKESSEADLIERLKIRQQEYEAKGTPLRSDDSIEVFERRWRVFQEKTVPVLQFISSQATNYQMITIEAMRVSKEAESTSFRTKDVISLEIQQKLVDFIFSSSKSLFDLSKLLAHKLESLESNRRTIDDQIITPLLHSFFDLSLKYNVSKRTGLTRRCVFLVTKNPHKLNEFIALFDQYGIEVLLLPHELRIRYYVVFYRLLQLPAMRSQGISIVAIFKEYTSLIRYYAMKTEDPTQYLPIDIRDGVKAVHLSQLDIFEYSPATETVTKRTFSHKTPGLIDLSRRVSMHSREVFGWDDIFVVEQTGWTYNQLKRLGVKVSSREMNIARWIQEKIYYKSLTDLKFTPIRATRSIDFTIDVYEDFLREHPFYNNSFAKDCGLLNLFHHVINTGLYFRAPLNRRLKNYWCPGLNAGIPLTPKADEIHEATYLAHDFGHFALPDLVFAGKSSPLHKLVYITWRMLSEALTMSIADMAFVDTIVKAGIDYDFHKRAIYPLFVALDLPLVDCPNQAIYLSNLKQILKANFTYCLLGDDSEYRQLLQRNSSSHGDSRSTTESLEAFQAKYTAFFIEDYKWTHFNYENMARKADISATWWEMIQPLVRGSSSRMFSTIDDLIERLQLKDLWFQDGNDEAEGEDQEEEEEGRSPSENSIANTKEERMTRKRVLSIIYKIFDYATEEMIFPLFQPTMIQSKAYRLDRAFRRYLIGQCAIFAKYAFIADSQEYFQRILSLIEKSPQQDQSSFIDLAQIAEIRSLYDEYLSLLVQKNLISQDDQITYRESYPLFDPMYLSYDSDHSQLSLAEVAREILFVRSPFSSLTKDRSLYSLLPKHRVLTETELLYLRKMHLLLEHSEAEVRNEVYVTRPGVLLLADIPHFPHPSNLITFLIAGISIEGSLELIAHKEASVARLTTSKTTAMNLPLYRLFPYLHEHFQENQLPMLQKQYLQDISSLRGQYQQQYREMCSLSAEIGQKDSQEMLNMMAPGTKCTFLCYSMRLEDYHRLLIGRAPYDGNESEVREVMKLIHASLFSRYPKIIWPWEDYLQGNNLQKLVENDLLVPMITPTTRTVVTNEAKRLFRALQITTDQPEYLQLAEFRSRITYLSFAMKWHTAPPSSSSLLKREEERRLRALRYHQKIVLELGHTSVLAAYQIAIPILVQHDQEEGGRKEMLALITTKEAVVRLLKEKEVASSSSSSFEWRELFGTLFDS